MYGKCEHKCILEDLDEILNNHSVYDKDTIKSIQIMKDGLLNDIHKEKMKDRRLKIEKIKDKGVK
jgi:hypothetical protein